MTRHTLPHARVFHDFMVGEVWAMHSEPAEGGGITLYATLLYDEWENAHASAKRAGAEAVMSLIHPALEGAASRFRFPDGSELVIADSGHAMVDPGGEPAERVVILSEEAHHAIRSAALHEWKPTSLRMPEGAHLVPLQAETAALIEKHRHPGESFNDVVIRIIHTADRKPH